MGGVVLVIFPGGTKVKRLKRPVPQPFRRRLLRFVVHIERRAADRERHAEREDAKKEAVNLENGHGFRPSGQMEAQVVTSGEGLRTVDFTGFGKIMQEHFGQTCSRPQYGVYS